MATFEYVDIPANATRLKPDSLEPATKIFTTLPDIDQGTRQSTEHASQAKAAIALVPQMLLSASIPPGAIGSSIATSNQNNSLLSTRDPLSVPIITANFRRFIARVGPVFWLQDRVEEIVLWKKGWKRTTVWLAVYGFFCCFPRMALLIPHIVLLAVMLCYYPEPGAEPIQINFSDSIADWQANIQAIQNLMGAFSDAHDAIVPLLPMLLPPQSSPPKSRSKSPSREIPKPSRRASDPRPPTEAPARPHHPLLIAILLSFLILLPVLMSDLLPLHFLFFLAGTTSVLALHPSIKRPLASTLLPALSGTGPGLSFSLYFNIPCLPDFNLFSHLRYTIAKRFLPRGSPSPPPRTNTDTLIRTYTFKRTIAPRDVYLFLRRLIDDDRLDDSVWHAPHAQVELWENERWVQEVGEKGVNRRRKSMVAYVREGQEEDEREDDAVSTSTVTAGDVFRDVKPPPPLSPPISASASTSGPSGTWSKANLRPNERVGWTRGRDGWSGVGGEVSSNLTFSLSPGWTFIESEGWRADLSGAWAVEGDAFSSVSPSVCVGADEDGWAYTTDTWTHPRPDGRPSEGWVTRRRRWVRRVCFKGVER